MLRPPCKKIIAMCVLFVFRQLSALLSTSDSIGAGTEFLPFCIVQLYHIFLPCSIQFYPDVPYCVDYFVF